MWLKDGSLQCDGCSERFDYPGPRTVVTSAARAHGWHIYRGMSLTGKDLDQALCEGCVGSSRTREPRVSHFDEEMPLF